MPVTFYRTSEELPAFTDYSMKGRTYRYMKGEALYPFGYGLSYTEFTYTSVRTSSDIIQTEGITVRAVITNIGSRDGIETVQIYIKADRDNTPNAQLKGIRKVPLQVGESREIAVRLPLDAFALYDEQGVNRIEQGRYRIYIGGTQPDSRSWKLTGKKPEALTVLAVESYVV